MHQFLNCQRVEDDNDMVGVHVPVVSLMIDILMTFQVDSEVRVVTWNLTNGYD
jgi:hypothetical protein